MTIIKQVNLCIGCKHYKQYSCCHNGEQTVETIENGCPGFEEIEMRSVTLNVFYRDGKKAHVMLLANKSDGTYQYVNMTKKHICPCKFNSIGEALKDLFNYENIAKVEIVM